MERISYHKGYVGEHELRVIREVENVGEAERKLQEIRGHLAVLDRKRKFLGKLLQDLRYRMDNEDFRLVVKPDELNSNHSDETKEEHVDSDDGLDNASLADLALADHVTDFSNRFVVHNAQIKWNNSLRNVVLRYMHQVSQRRGYVYYTSRKAVKFILDIIDEQNMAKSPSPPDQLSNHVESGDDHSQASTFDENDADIQRRIQNLLQDGRDFVNADDSEKAKSSGTNNKHHTNRDDAVQDFLTQNTYHVRLVAPQIQLQSEKHSKAVALVTARAMRLKVYQIMDKVRPLDDVSGLVQRRFVAELDNVQSFVIDKENLATEFVHMYAAHRYGTQAGSAWPPWVPIEVMFDFGLPSLGFSRIVQRTSASLRYDKYNKLRLKYHDNVSDEPTEQKSGNQDADDRMDHLWVNFPALRAVCDSKQYYALYIMAVDLLMWSEPLEKTRNERLEKIMLASDFSDLRGAPEMVVMLQERIRQLDELKMHFHMNEKFLDRQGWQDRITMDQDLAGCEDELFFMMKAITTSQRKVDERVEGSQSTAHLRWNIAASEIIWHLTLEVAQPLAEFQLGNASFERTEYSDGSKRNQVEIAHIRGFNLMSNAVYPEMIGAYGDGAHVGIHDRHSKMLCVNWTSLEAIAGIPVIDHFEVNLFPLKVQLEYDTAKKLQVYMNPGSGGTSDGTAAASARNSLAQHDDDDDDADEKEAQLMRDKSYREAQRQQVGKDVGAGPLDRRLQPTHDVPQKGRLITRSPSTKSKSLGDRFKMPHFSNDSGLSFTFNNKKIGNKKSNESLAPDGRGRDAQLAPNGSAQDGESKKKRFHIPLPGRRSGSADSRREKNDDLTQMMDRANNYMTLAYVKIPSVVLCLSYKGKGTRNLGDVHDLVFRMPTLEYHNKTWSTLDLTDAVKRDVIRALISHTGAIIGNKFSKHKPGKHQQSRLRELASSSVMLPSPSGTTNASDASLDAYGSPESSVHDLAARSDGEQRVSDVTDEDSLYYRRGSQAASTMSVPRTPSEVASTDYSQTPMPMADEQVSRECLPMHGRCADVKATRDGYAGPCRTRSKHCRGISPS